MGIHMVLASIEPGSTYTAPQLDHPPAGA